MFDWSLHQWRLLPYMAVPTQATSTSSERGETLAPARGDLTLFFVIAYLSQGIASQFGLIAQPIQYFMMKGLHMSAADISASLAIMMLPWVVKPIYGLISDFIPLFGFRRKSYLVIGNVMALIGFATLFFSTSLPWVLAGLFMVALGSAIATALMVGVALESGRTKDQSENTQAKTYFGVQAFYYYAGGIIASVIGGTLCQRLAPEMSLHVAAAISILPVLLVANLVITQLPDTKSALDRAQLSSTWAAFKRVIFSPAIWLAGGFAWFWSFSPATGVPLYFFESKTLGFSQADIGHLAACNSVGMLLGVLIFQRAIMTRSLTWQLLIVVTLGCLSTLSYLLLDNLTVAFGIELFRGITNMIAVLTMYGLAADACPQRTEVSVMAILLAVRSMALDASTFVGGQLFTHVFHEQYQPLVFVAAGLLCLSLGLIPFTKRTWSKVACRV